MWKTERIDGYQHFLFFPLCFQKAFSSSSHCVVKGEACQCPWFVRGEERETLRREPRPPLQKKKKQKKSKALKALVWHLSREPINYLKKKKTGLDEQATGRTGSGTSCFRDEDKGCV